MKVKGKHILVTGGTGMIGQAIVRHLQDAGADVATLSRRGARAGNPEHHAVTGDINDPTTLDFTGFDAVVHGAAFVGFGLSPEKEGVLMQTNVEGTRNVLDAAVKAGCKKVVHVSSVAALGATHGRPRGEDWFHERPLEFTTAYERSKYEAHKLLLAEDRIETAAVMPSIVLGLGDSSSGLILKSYLKGRMKLKPDHPGRAGFVHVEDVAAATVLALEKGKGPYVLNETDMTLPQLFDRFEATTGVPAPKRVVPFFAIKAGGAVINPVARLFGKPGLLNKDFIRSLERDSQFDATRARTELGWDPDMDRHLADDAALWRRHAAEGPVTA